jgi:hypothetical protein
VVAVHGDVGCDFREGGFWSIVGGGKGVEVLGNGFGESGFPLGGLLDIFVTDGGIRESTRAWDAGYGY